MSEELQLNEYLNLITPIVVTTIGLVGNSLVLIILSNVKFRKISFFRYLIVMTVVDLFNLILCWPDYHRDFFKVNFSGVICKLYEYFAYVMYQLSPWIMVLSTLDRLIAVKFPTRFQFRNSIKFQIAAIGTLFLSLLLIDFPLLILEDVFLQFNQSKCNIVGTQNGVVMVTVNIFFSTFIPFIIIITSTCIIVKQLINQRKQWEQNKQDFSKEFKLAKTFIAIGSFYLVCYLPFNLGGLSYYLSSNSQFYWTILTDALNSLNYVYSSCDFFVIFASNRIFRKYFFSSFRRLSFMLNEKSTELTAIQTATT